MSDPLLTMLVESRAIEPRDAERASNRQREAGGGIDTALLELGLVSEDRLEAALAEVTGLPVPAAAAVQAPEPRARRVFPAKVAERHAIAPFALDGRELSVVTPYPPDAGLLDEISFMLSLQLKVHVATEWRVRELVHLLYQTPLAPRFAALAVARGGAVPGGEAVPATAQARHAASAPPPAPPAEVTPAAARADASAPSPTPSALDQGAADRDAVIEAAMRVCAAHFEFAAALVAVKGRLVGHDARGGGEASLAACRALSVSLADPGLFRTPLDTRAPYLGPPPADAGTGALLAALGRTSPRAVLIHPVFLRDRPVCVFYADNGDAPVSASRLGDLFLALGGVGPALERVIKARKGQASPLPAGASAPVQSPTAPVPATAPPAGPAPGQVAPAVPTQPADAWSVQEPARPSRPGEDDLTISVDVDLGEFEVASASDALAPERIAARTSG